MNLKFHLILLRNRRMLHRQFLWNLNPNIRQFRRWMSGIRISPPDILFQLPTGRGSGRGLIIQLVDQALQIIGLGSGAINIINAVGHCGHRGQRR